MDEAALVGEGHVAAHEDIVGDSLAEDLYAEDVGDDLFSLALEVWVDEGDVVVGGDDVAEGGEALLDAGDADAVGEGIAQMLQFLVGCGGGNEEALAVAGGEAADDAGAGDGGADGGDDVLQFGFEDGVEVFRGAEGNQGV